MITEYCILKYWYWKLFKNTTYSWNEFFPLTQHKLTHVPLVPPHVVDLDRICVSVLVQASGDNHPVCHLAISSGAIVPGPYHSAHGAYLGEYFVNFEQLHSRLGCRCTLKQTSHHSSFILSYDNDAYCCIGWPGSNWLCKYQSQQQNGRLKILKHVYINLINGHVFNSTLAFSGNLHVGYPDPHQVTAIVAAEGTHLAPHDIRPVRIAVKDLIAVPANSDLVVVDWHSSQMWTSFFKQIFSTKGQKSQPWSIFQVLVDYTNSHARLRSRYQLCSFYKENMILSIWSHQVLVDSLQSHSRLRSG